MHPREDKALRYRPTNYYNLKGQLMQGTLDTLPHGIYVAQGHKLFVK